MPGVWAVPIEPTTENLSASHPPCHVPNLAQYGPVARHEIFLESNSRSDTVI